MAEYLAVLASSSAEYRQTAPMNTTTSPSHQGFAGGWGVVLADGTALLDKTCILQNGVNTLAFAFYKITKFSASKEKLIPALSLQNLLPFCAVIQLSEAIHPKFVIVLWHFRGTQNATPVGNFNIETSFLESGDVQAFHAFCRGNTEDFHPI